MELREVFTLLVAHRGGIFGGGKIRHGASASGADKAERTGLCVAVLSDCAARELACFGGTVGVARERGGAGLGVRGRDSEAQRRGGLGRDCPGGGRRSALGGGAVRNT